MFELIPTNGRKSFYGKAVVKQSGDVLTLQSYSTDVCSYNQLTGEFKRLWDGYSATTMSHINSFVISCCHFNEGGKAWWESLEVQ